MAALYQLSYVGVIPAILPPPRTHPFYRKLASTIM
jgi:hypothetical protein